RRRPRAGLSETLREVAGVVLLHRDRAGLNQSLRHEAARHQQGTGAHLWRCTARRGESWRVFPRTASACRRRFVRWPRLS
ncbi:hypothetical protein ABTL77_20595, partial [Acinetobacter baumannii]